MGLLARLSSTSSSDLSPLADIIEHLQRLLNTRKGDAPMDRDYGISDFNGAMHPDALRALRKDIERTIEKYETRLERVRVTDKSAKESLVLELDIVGRLRDGRTLRLRTDLLPGGEVRVRG